jgi:acetoin utilization deacetylase AcuC-like enzyme
MLQCSMARSIGNCASHSKKNVAVQHFVLFRVVPLHRATARPIPMIAYYADHFVLPLPAGHRFPMAKYALLRDRLVARWPEIRMREAPPATDEELARAHAPAYVAAVADGSLSAAQQREIGFPWSPAMAERSRRSVGGTVSALRTAMREGVSANLAGGTHHADAESGSGFCVFNDVAVAARALQAEWAVNGHRACRVAVVDLDVHQGDGTAKIFRDDPTVFTLSLHGEKNFPFRKETGDLDVGLPDGCGDAEYLAALDRALGAMEDGFSADAVIYLAGADPHEGDRLGRLRLTDAGMEARDRRVFEWAWRRRLPLALAMAGGYGRELETTLRVQEATYAVAVEYHRRWRSAG